ncbi:MAG TPA: helix-turn-helix domain-containing protein [Gaiellaceae bacterium]|jgi:DNA-binding HxlR family transcriptional regulator|nr:helix-turn-helix domain-containing protein [Gaiellaceae bacterium]
MTSRSYGQYCGLAYALDLVGERWALLIIRDLIMGPKRFSDLNRGLPGIPSNVLTARLKELEQNGIVGRRVLPRPDGSVVYELTEYGQELEEIVLRLGLWGARSLGDPRDGELPTAGALLVALRASFQPEAAGKSVSFEVHIGEAVVHARVAGGALETGEGPLEGADLVLAGDATLRRYMSAEVTADEALKSGRVAITGDRRLLDRFGELFRLPPSVVAAS